MELRESVVRGLFQLPELTLSDRTPMQVHKLESKIIQHLFLLRKSASSSWPRGTDLRWVSSPVRVDNSIHLKGKGPRFPSILCALTRWLQPNQMTVLLCFCPFWVSKTSHSNLRRKTGAVPAMQADVDALGIIEVAQKVPGGDWTITSLFLVVALALALAFPWYDQVPLVLPWFGGADSPPKQRALVGTTRMQRLSSLILEGSTWTTAFM